MFHLFLLLPNFTAALADNRGPAPRKARIRSTQLPKSLSALILLRPKASAALRFRTASPGVSMAGTVSVSGTTAVPRLKSHHGGYPSGEPGGAPSSVPSKLDGALYGKRSGFSGDASGAPEPADRS